MECEAGQKTEKDIALCLCKLWLNIILMEPLMSIAKG